MRYQIGGRVRVRVVRVNLEQAKIDFTLVEGKREPSSPAPLPRGPNAGPKERGGKKKGKKA